MQYNPEEFKTTAGASFTNQNNATSAAINVAGCTLPMQVVFEDFDAGTMEILGGYGLNAKPCLIATRAADAAREAVAALIDDPVDWIQVRAPAATTVAKCLLYISR